MNYRQEMTAKQLLKHDVVCHLTDQHRIGYFFLSEYRRIYDMTQAQLAALCNVTKKTVWQWEKAPHTIALKYLCRIATAFNLTVGDLVYGVRIR